VPLHAHAVLVIDEAQHLQPEVLEQLRLISNVHDDAGTLLQIMLVGQPALDAVLSRPELRQLKQRVSRHVRLEPLGIAELSQYIDHRLAVARDGSTAQPGAVTFAPEALSVIWRLSGGTPRVINLLCDRALEAAYEQQKRVVGALLVEAAAEELGIARTPATAGMWQGVGASAAPPVTNVPSAPLPPEDVPVFSSEEEPVVAPARNRGLVFAAAVVAVAVAVWFGVRAFYSSPAPETPFTGAAPPPAERRSTPEPAAPAPPSAAPAAEPAPTSAPAPIPAPSSPSASVSTPPPAASGIDSREPPADAPTSFEIVVASFRTVTRASAVAAELVALGQPVRQRTADGWEQVLAGPFATRAAAEEARQKLDLAGYTGTQIVPAAR
jgi:cell division protein FtsN